MSDYTVIMCEHIGIAGTTRVVVKRFDDHTYEARVGIAIMGETNQPLDELQNANPFDKPPAFYDNYAKGVGRTEEEAIAAMKADMRSLADSLHDE